MCSPRNKQWVGAPSPVEGPACLSAQEELGQRSHLGREDVSHGDESAPGPAMQRQDAGGKLSCRAQGLGISEGSGRLVFEKREARRPWGTHEEYVLVSSAQAPSTFSAICSPLLRQ